MKLHFKPVTSKNREQVECLELYPHQIEFIESVKDCLIEADEVKEWKPVGIYDGATLIGFAMYGLFLENSSTQVWLDRLLIDKKYQGKGYGKKATIMLLEKLSIEYNQKRIYLSVYNINKVAIRLYKEIGFYFNGEYDTKGEKIMVYDCKY